MTVLVPVLYTLLAGDATLTAQLASYNGSPAIFSNQKLPADVSAPYVVISPPVTDNSFDALKEFGRDIVHDVWVVFPETGSVTALDTAAERVRTLLPLTQHTSAHNKKKPRRFSCIPPSHITAS